jgi:hypothetical protein
MRPRPSEAALAFGEELRITTPEQLAERLAAALPGQLKCVVLYGSAAAGDFVEGASNYNVLAIVEPLGISELDAVKPAIVAWNRAGHSTPLLFTRSQLAESLDAFPIELLDIQQSRRILWGADLPAEWRVDHGHLRRQVQRELNGKLLKLRGRYLLTEGKPKAIADLMLRSLSTFLVLFRAALRLHQKEIPETKLEALQALSRHIPFDVAPFERLFEFKQRQCKARGALPEVSFQSYLSVIEQVADAVNHESHPKGHKT